MSNEKIIETSVPLLATPEFIGRRIYLIRGKKIMLDSDLAELYQIETKNLNLAVRRNLERFPEDFMFQLSKEENQSLRLQFETSNFSRGGRRYSPYAFTELGVAMLSSVLKSDRAVQMNIYIMRAFVKIRELLATHADLARKIEGLEMEQREQGTDISLISKAVSKLLEEKTRLKSAIGFQVD